MQIFTVNITRVVWPHDLTGINHYNLYKKSNETYLFCLFMILLAVSIKMAVALAHFVYNGVQTI